MGYKYLLIRIDRSKDERFLRLLRFAEAVITCDEMVPIAERGTLGSRSNHWMLNVSCVCASMVVMRLTFLAALSLAPMLLAPSQPAWVAKSNQNAQVLLKIMAQYSPEDAGELGVQGMDDRITIPAPDRPEKVRRDTNQAVKELQSRLASEKDPLVKQDLEILIKAGERDVRSSEAYEQRVLPYINVPRMVFSGTRALLNPQVPPERQKQALIRLRRYAGMDAGYTPTTVLAEQVFRSKLNTPGLIGPAKAEVEQDLSNMNSYTSGIEDLFKKYKITGYETALRKLQDQFSEFQDFTRKQVLPKARTDFRLPPELYAINLENVGVDYAPADIERLAKQSYRQIQNQMQNLAVKVANEHGYSSVDYRDVIRQLKKDQLKPDEVMPTYHKTLEQIENIIRKEHLVTLPSRPCIIRLASAAETAQQPAPHYLPPTLIGNNGERGQFVLPVGTVGSTGEALKYDDFTFPAAAWTLTAHEARPGHDLQFTAMVERGVSQARAIFAFNSTNVEGWALYAEWFMYPYMPDDAKLISLQLRLLRAARAFVDPELQEGKLTRRQALDLLEKDVVLSEAFATEEVDRFTFRMPGQAVSYFDGYTRLLQLRSDVEKGMGPKFNLQKFHDFILSEGLLPPDLLRKAVMNQFVPEA
jgi:uncharacterized protein (DUF885 family)